MLETLHKKLKSWERSIRKSFGDDISTPQGRRGAWWHFQIFDHAFLRVLWTNFYKVADGVYRSNHPSPKRLEKYHEMGIRTVLNLRGAEQQSHWLFEKEACEKLGLDLVICKIYARRPATREEMLHLIDTLTTLPKPFVLHCKSGADRAGLASAIYQIAVEKKSVAEAKKQLSFRYLHIKSSKTGVCDYILDLYEERLKHGHIELRDWFDTEYDGQAVRNGFDDGRRIPL
ncbi:tyrosine-protein phosphatase [Alphaproteobacteria bacterium KMM 3653]|uniref:Tyrosine-protein phosphatase n=1 Tax=Harenicola maris TaxID=2841044 RepID=A0AAP2CTV6_9RHOB|nr:tyrosine-protein phosphatase [Harenicola maris]